MRQLIYVYVRVFVRGPVSGAVMWKVALLLGEVDLPGNQKTKSTCREWVCGKLPATGGFPLVP